MIRIFNLILDLSKHPLLRPHVSGYLWIRKFFFADSKISTSTHIRIQIEYVSGFTLSSLANF